MQRRGLLKLGVGAAAVLTLAGGALTLWQGGLRDGRLGPSARDVFLAVGRAVLEGTLPGDESDRQIALNGLLERIDLLVGALPPHAQAELSQLLALLASTAGRRAIAGLDSEWPDAGVSDIQQALQSMRTSRLGLRQQAYHALHDIVGGAYFSDSSTWPRIGYPGPMAL